jgi:enoyl-CoA hydratase/carnithine racemase
MKTFEGKTISWQERDGAIELSLQRSPSNEIGSETLLELEAFAAELRASTTESHALIVHSVMPAGFCAGADLRELYRRAFEQPGPAGSSVAEVRTFLERIHAAFNALDDAPLVTIAAVHGVTFGGGFELALTTDLIVADRTARFGFPELRLGLIPGFGGIPRLKRDLGNGVVRDLLLTGRSINATKAQAAGLVSQVVAEGEALPVARTLASQIGKFDLNTVRDAKKFIKPIPCEELRREIEIFCELFVRPAVAAGLRRFVESNSPLPYLP